MTEKKKIAKPKARSKADPNLYPTGWDARSIRELVDHYENQTEAQAVAEDDAAYRSTTQTMMAIPVELVPAVQRLIAKRAG